MSVTDRPDFYLKHLHVENFRLLKEFDIDFNPTLNVIIGRNNDGKSSLIDVLRLLFNMGTYEEMDDYIRFTHKDPSRLDGTPSEISITIEATFHGKDGSDAESIFAELGTDITVAEVPGYAEYKLKIVASYVFDEERGRYRYTRKIVTGGIDFAHPVSISSMDYMKAIYLDALRDIRKDYKKVGSEIERLLYAHGDGAKLKDIPDAVRGATQSKISDATDANAHEKEARTNFAKYAAPYKYDIDKEFLKFIPTNLDDEMLRQLGARYEYGVHGPETAALGLGSNGLGINNLIYSSIVLSRAKDDDSISRFFLIEEPEAHLHPQLQDSFFSELNKITKHQLFVTSHSPTITAKADIKKIIAIRDDITDKNGSRPIALGQVVKDPDQRYLHKFLDVTRSQLLFANSVIFVEGVTEAMLMQRFSEIMGTEYDLRANGVEIVIIDAKHGYDRFADIIGPGGLDIKSALIGDGDEEPDSLPQNKEELIKKCAKTREISNRQAEVRSKGTFELELLVAATGSDEMTKILQTAAKSARGAANDTTNEEFAKDFADVADPLLAYYKMKQKHGNAPEDGKPDKRYITDEAKWYGKTRTNSEFLSSKSEYAYNLYELLLDDNNAKNFLIPQYIQDAIKHVTIGDAPDDATD